MGAQIAGPIAGVQRPGVRVVEEAVAVVLGAAVHVLNSVSILGEIGPPLDVLRHSF
ncbi:MAG: hypothetical protein ABSF69_01020 [Polyangiaceae bacterium]|jgi:hypothetical protein